MSNKVSAIEFEVISILSKNELLSDLKAKIIERSIEEDQFWLSNIPRLEDFLRKRPHFFNVSRDPPLVSSKITTMEMLELDHSLIDEDLKHQYGRDELFSIGQKLDGRPTEFIKDAFSHIYSIAIKPEDFQITKDKAISSMLKWPPGFIKPSESHLEKLEAVIKVLNDMTFNPQNSTRLRFPIWKDRTQSEILVKFDVIFPLVSSHWKTIDDMKEDLKIAHNSFFTNGGYFQSISMIEKMRNTDEIARTIVDILTLKPHSKIEQILESMPDDIADFLKSNEGLKGFVQFYPALFVLDGSSGINLKKFKSVTVKEMLPNPWKFHLQGIDKIDQERLKFIVNLMMTEQHTPENSQTLVINNQDLAFFSKDFILKRLPGNLKFDGNEITQLRHLKDFTLSYQQIFLTYYNVPFIRLKLMQGNLDEKAVSLNILEIKNENPEFLIEDIFAHLSELSRIRIRSVMELQAFFELHPKFHPDCLEMKPKIIGNKKITSEVDLNIITIAGNIWKVWKLDDFYEALIEKDIKNFESIDELQEYVKKSNFFTFRNGWLWSNFEDIDQITLVHDEIDLNPIPPLADDLQTSPHHEKIILQIAGTQEWTPKSLVKRLHESGHKYWNKTNVYSFVQSRPNLFTIVNESCRIFQFSSQDVQDSASTKRKLTPFEEKMIRIAGRRIWTDKALKSALDIHCSEEEMSRRALKRFISSSESIFNYKHPYVQVKEEFWLPMKDVKWKDLTELEKKIVRLLGNNELNVEKIVKGLIKMGVSRASGISIESANVQYFMTSRPQIFSRLLNGPSYKVSKEVKEIPAMMPLSRSITSSESSSFEDLSFGSQVLKSYGAGSVEVSKLEQDVINVANRASVWTLIAFQASLIDNGIKTFLPHPLTHLKDYLQQRSHLFHFRDAMVFEVISLRKVEDNGDQLDVENEVDFQSGVEKVVKIIRQNLNNVENSVRITLESKQAIMFRADWIFLKGNQYIT